MMIRMIYLTAFALVLAGTAPCCQAEMILYTAFLDGPSEATPNTSPGTGFAAVGYDPVAQTLALTVVFGDLVAPTTAAHIHAPTPDPFMGAAGVATETPYFENFPIGFTSGVYANVFDMTDESTYSANYLAANGGTAQGAEAALVAALASGRAYLNIHTTEYPGGEIRGFFRPVPEPSAMAMWGLCSVIGLLGYRKLRRRA